jgi:hypothetical protein
MNDGKQFRSGGNRQRESFASKAMSPKEDKPSSAAAPSQEAAKLEVPSGSTVITRTPEGGYTAKHADGEETSHPSLGHLAMTMHAKNEEGDAMHVNSKDGMFSSHRVGADGMVEGPNDHGSADEAAEHMKSSMGGDAMADLAGSGLSDGHAGGDDLY